MQSTPIIGLVALGLGAALSYAATATASMAVGVTVPGFCVASHARLILGAYLMGRLNPESVVTVTCNYPAPYTLGIAHSPPAYRIESIPAARTYPWPSAPTSRLDHVEVDPSSLTQRSIPAFPSSEVIMIVVSY